MQSITSKHNQRHNMKKYNYNLYLFLDSRLYPCNLPLQTQRKLKVNLLYFKQSSIRFMSEKKVDGVVVGWGLGEFYEKGLIERLQ